jgi:hypothetical protein
MSSDERPDWRDRSTWPDPVQDSGGPTRWTNPAHDYAAAPDGASSWATAAEPASVPPAVDPAAERVGWLNAARTAPGPDAA